MGNVTATAQKNLRFSNNYREYRSGTLVENGLRKYLVNVT